MKVFPATSLQTQSLTALCQAKDKDSQKRTAFVALLEHSRANYAYEKKQVL